MWDQLSVSQDYTLVDSEGNNIEGEQLGLLLYHGGTVCNEYFDDSDADEICISYFGYARAGRWTRKESFDIQTDYTVKDKWKFGCDHSQDVFLSCSTDGGNLKIIWDIIADINLILKRLSIIAS